MALREATQVRIYGIQLDDITISDLVFADGICLLEDDFNAAQELLSSVIAAAAKTGFNQQCQKDATNIFKLAPENLKCGDDVLENVSHSNYLMGTITDNNDIAKGIKNRIAKATITWK